jgi:uracil-DNA glycosylase
MQHAPLEELLADIRACRVCAPKLKHEPRPVLQASATARLLICGQAPGTRVHETGLPFNDPSGDRLRDWLGLDRESFYDASRVAIVPMGFCYPGRGVHGDDLPPRRECAPLWQERVRARLKAVELTLLVGRYAQSWHLGPRAKDSVGETVRAWRDYLPRYLPLPHPSWRNTGWLKRNPWFAEEVLPHARREARRLAGSGGP